MTDPTLLPDLLAYFEAKPMDVAAQKLAERVRREMMPLTTLEELARHERES